MAEPPQLVLRLLGPLSVARGEAPVPLPKSQKTRALLAYLVVTGRPQRRDRLSSMFWDVTDDPRGALRWSLSKLRALNDEGAERILADREAVAFDPAGALVDVLELRAAVAAGLETQPLGHLQTLTTQFRGSFLEGLELPDFDVFQAWLVGEREHWRSVQVRLLERLVERQKATPEAALDPARQLVRLTPEDECARARLIELLWATDRREEAREHYTLGTRQIERTGVDRGELRRSYKALTTASAPRSANADREAARQTVRFCTTRDGVRIAYATLGEGPPLVKTANWMSHLDYDWKSPLWRHLARELSRDFSLIRYDQRGNGLSDWELPEVSLDAFVSDLETVVDAAGLRSFPLLGVSQGCRVAMAYAVKHPERVTRLVLYGGGARGWKHRSQQGRETRSALQVLLRQGWGQDSPTFRQVFTTLFMPGASHEQIGWFNELQRVSASPENAVRISEAHADIDVTDLLPKIHVPTLVLHATQDAMVPFDEARAMAAPIPDARFVALDSQNHLLLDDEPAFARFLAEVRHFLSPGDL